ncbi:MULTISPECIES: acetyl-CoA carboxylase biotin carboxyl carrier protein [Virgibacillus]|uniref:acetyl-CoA carboxylase biotin carboxyl carrier protein n=1 Tax=Virgibacillus TaxID=84406 RepID=UPI0017E7DAA8|nr:MULTISPECIES: acetyl-CoA carboxylase biotin carboxyl carrier protein [Virgibacillus]MBU5265305.1 acetyl-CoA carboxylase biotin carboxyl carrier protein [Virgibacillus proomii]NWO15114.1 acetyl-CoA carboxylase biotin carboxyl carrier protein [Virgibacillus sp.]
MLNMHEIQEIIKLIDQSSIEEFTYEANGTAISLKKSVTPQLRVNDIKSQIQPNIEQQSEPDKLSEEKVEKPIPQEKAKTAYDHEIVSPMVGTFYAAPSPEKESFVTVGSKVEESTVVCIVEAMKLFNEIEAEVCGEIVEILVENGQLVEYGQPLFRVSTK